MSVIDKALKAAQSEKNRRGGAPPPLIVPLRSGQGSSEFSWKRALLLGAAGATLFGATAVGVKLFRKDPRAAPSPPPTLLGESAVAPRDTARTTPPDTKAADLPPPKTSAAANRPATPRRAPVSAPRSVATRSQSKVAAETTEAGGLRIAVEEPREDAARLFAAAVAAHRSGDLSYARVAYERVLALAPSDVDAMNNLGVLLSAQREFDRAERLLRRAISLAPRNAGVWNNLGTVLRERGQTSDAIAAFQHALQIDPLNESARVSLAQQYLAIGSLPRARELLEQVLQGSPAVPEALYALGQVLEAQGDKAGAIRAYTSFVRTAPGRYASHVEFVRRRIDQLNAAP